LLLRPYVGQGWVENPTGTRGDDQGIFEYGNIADVVAVKPKVGSEPEVAGIFI